ncbi:DgyrCDS7682 [Dimorphilus gyrociliatus]|uniref:DgyrCDS7682 n=1 Tax=Dimorphilus gyrociliatus TaxID=2664684 RepID=A0A7I8VUD4_9ANNE|nr:DgyrCDS7682 [Dimorphilus gyrociliatus]
MMKEAMFYLWSVILLISIAYIQNAEIDMTDCGKTKNCWQKPSGCQNETDCIGIVTWKKNGNDLDFEVMGKKQYAAIGFSSDEAMGDDSIHACLKPSTGNPVINTYKSTGESKPPLVSYNGLTNKKIESEGSVLRCRFTRPQKTGNTDVFDLDSGKKYILFWAMGDLSGNELTPHVKAERGHSDGKIDYTKLPSSPSTGNLDMTDCGKTKNCWKKPSSCKDETDCIGIVTWKKNGNDLDFEVMGKKQYAAIGFSSDEAMGDDSIHACLKPSTGNPVINTYKSTGESKPPLVSYNGLTNKKIESEGSVLRCRFTRPQKTGNTDVFDLDSGKKYILFWAMGDLSGNELTAHVKAERGHSDGKIDYTSSPAGSSAEAIKSNLSILLLTSTLLIVIQVLSN